jgi:PPM family protein phosphatase
VNEPGSDDAKTAVDAIRRAHTAVCERAGTTEEDSDQDPPGSTIVVAIVRGTRATVAWLGDSRAYLVSESSAERVTRDHSWKNEIERMGYTAPAAMGNMGSALTRCIGPLEGGLYSDVEPEVEIRDLPHGSTLVLCTDGLWGYFPEAEQIADVVRANPDATETELAVRMVNLALVCGGEDNVTVAVIRGATSP